MDSLFAVTAPGLGLLAAQELQKLNLSPQVEPGGVSFKADLDGLYSANLHLRTASRILARLGQFFYATTFAELRDKASRLPWERFLKPGQPVSIRVTCQKSKLMHSDAVAERIVGAIYDRLGKESPLKKTGDEESDSVAQLIVVRVAKDQVMVSMDSSGELLHKRGYRLAVAKAPLRETLAAAILMAAKWDSNSPIIDPFCGSGTICIEAAQIALGIPPGINRRFAFMEWPGYSEERWESLHSAALAPKMIDFPIYGSDRDAGAIKMAGENAFRARVDKYTDFACHAVSALPLPNRPGWVVTNPPYGLRVSEGKDLRNLYAQFGNVLRSQFRGWNVAILCNDPQFLGQTGLKLDTTLSLINGGVSVRLGIGLVN